MNTNTLHPQVTSSNKQSGIMYSGGINLLDCIVENNSITFGYENFTIQDSVDFLHFLNETVADMMYYGQCLQTVSKECDILVIRPNIIQWF